MREIGIFDISYNRNSKVMYSKFTSTIMTVRKVEKECSNCDEGIIADTMQDLLADWFVKVGEIEEMENATNPIKTEVIKETYYSDGSLKTRQVKVYR